MGRRDACKEGEKKATRWRASLPVWDSPPLQGRIFSCCQSALRSGERGSFMLHSLELQVHDENILAGACNSYGFSSNHFLNLLSHPGASSNHFLSPDCVSTPCTLPRRMSVPKGRYSLWVRIRHHSGSREVAKMTLEGP